MSEFRLNLSELKAQTPAALLAMAAILFVVSAILFRRRQSEMLVG